MASEYPGNAVAASLKPGMIKTGVFFVDETGLLRSNRDPVFVVGLVHSREPSVLTRRIQNIRDRHHWYDEMKWSLITGGNKNIQAYHHVVDAFFDCQLDEARFGCIVFKKSELDIKRYFLGSAWEAYEAFAALEIQLSIYDDEVVTVLADDMSVPPGVTFEQNVKRRVNEKKGRLAVTNVLRLNSKGCELIQLADLLAGAVAYDFKLQMGAIPNKPSPEKQRMLDHVKQRVGAADFTSGFVEKSRQARKMRVRLFRARGEKKKAAGHDLHEVTPATGATLEAPSEVVNVPPGDLADRGGHSKT